MSAHLPLWYWLIPLILTLTILCIYHHKASDRSAQFNRGDVWDKLEASTACVAYAAVAVVATLVVWCICLLIAVIVYL